MIIRPLIASLLAIASACAHAGMGSTQVAPMPGEEAVTVFYPTAAADAPVQRGPFAVSMAVGAKAERGNGRLVVISHGTAGNPWTHTDLAHALVDAGFIVAFPQHKGDNAFDSSRPGPASWKQRPLEVSHAIDAVMKDGRFAPLLSTGKVGVYGMSAGGHTALTLAGGRWSPATLRDHCKAHIAEDFTSCVGPSLVLKGNALDSIKQAAALAVIEQKLDDATWQSHTDPRIGAVVAGVPFAADFDAASLATPAVPLALVTARKDKWLVPRFHSDRILAACKACETLADLRDGGHGALLSPPVPPQILGETLRDLLADPPGFDRSQMAAVDRAIASFFLRHLQ